MDYMIPICIYSHSDFFDILKIQLDYFNRIFRGTNQEIYLFSNAPYTMGGGVKRRYLRKSRSNIRRSRKRNTKKFVGGNLDIKYKTILYDDKLPYMSRVKNCMEQVNSEYIFMIQDNDILFRYDSNLVDLIVDKMKAHGIDTIDCKRNSTSNDKILIRDNIFIAPKDDNDGRMFSFQPRIWLRSSMLRLFSNFLNNTYDTGEEGEIQNFTKKYQKTYCIVDNNTSIKSIGYQYSSSLCVIHITTRSKVITCREGSNVDPIIRSEIDKIFNTYLTNTKRQIDTKICLI